MLGSQVRYDLKDPANAPKMRKFNTIGSNLLVFYRVCRPIALLEFHSESSR